MAVTHRTKARDRAKHAAESVLHVWQSGDLPAKIAQSVLIAKTDLPCAKWTLANRVLMIAQGTGDARGFNQWKEAGRNVRKGAQAIHILGPVFARIDKDDDEAARPCIGFRAIPVFRLEDTEGDPVASTCYAPDTLPPLQSVAASIGLRVAYCPALGDYLGRYMPKHKSIELCTHDTATWFHELAHAVDDYLGTLKPAKKSSASYKDAEVVAEFTAASLCNLYGIPYETNALRYIESYRKDATKAVHRLLARIESVLAFILEQETTTATATARIAA